MRSLISTLLIAGCLVIAAPAPAHADECHFVTTTIFVQGAAQSTSTWVCSGDVDNGTTTTTVRTDLDRDPVCVRTAIAMGIPSSEFCDEPGDDTEPVEITPGVIKTLVSNMPLPAAALEVQPPNGRTLVNFDTNFLTTVSPVEVPIRLAGHQEQVHLHVGEYTWRFGDGESAVSTTPGAPYPNLQITHSYERKGSMSPQVDATWVGSYQVDGGTPVSIPGSVIIAGTPVSLQVVTATPTLVGYE